MTESFVPLDAGRLLRTLAEHDVRFIVIGGIAAISHGSSQVTRDLDICYEKSPENLEALAAALSALGARLRGAPPDLRFRLDARTLRNDDSFTFTTVAGDLDCLDTPSGTRGYAELIVGAVEVSLEDVTVRVTSLDDLIRMKRAAGRPKDRAALEILGALRDELDGTPP
jgi:predicted nucleotidyltransferase